MLLTGIDERVRRSVEAKLRDIASSEQVQHLIAVESGSRAWGFPSPDSDFDVRFVYRHPRVWYLSLEKRRDVIEYPIIDDFDVSGWDIRKTLGLLLKHNAVVSEWINSPIRYQSDHPSMETLRSLVDVYFDPRGYALHYASLAKNNADRWAKNSPTIQAKRYFYALRPALAARALRINATTRPPIALQELIGVCDLPTDVVGEITELVELKSKQREAAPTRRSHAIEQLVLSEIAVAEATPARRHDAEFAAALNEFSST
jgi:uncharacterized protein